MKFKDMDDLFEGLSGMAESEVRGVLSFKVGRKDYVYMWKDEEGIFHSAMNDPPEFACCDCDETRRTQ